MPIGKVWISFTVCLFFCSFVRLRISPPRIKLAASNFARRFISRESHILGNFSPQKQKLDKSASWRVRRPKGDGCERCGGSACVDIGQSPLTYLLIYRVENQTDRQTCKRRWTPYPRNCRWVWSVNEKVWRHFRCSTDCRTWRCYEWKKVVWNTSTTTCSVILVGSKRYTCPTIVSRRYRQERCSSRRCASSRSTATCSTRSRRTLASFGTSGASTSPTTGWGRSTGVCWRPSTGRSTTSTCARTRSTATVVCSGCERCGPVSCRAGRTGELPARPEVVAADAAELSRSCQACARARRRCAVSPSLTGSTFTASPWIRSAVTAATEYTDDRRVRADELRQQHGTRRQSWKRVSGSRVTGSTILAGSGWVTGQ